MRKILLLALVILSVSFVLAEESNVCPAGVAPGVSGWCRDGDVYVLDENGNKIPPRDIASYCKDDLGRDLKDSCFEGWYGLHEYECTGPCSNECFDRVDYCPYGCTKGRCAKRGEILASLGFTEVPGRSFDTDANTQFPDGNNPYVQGICVDVTSDGSYARYWIDHCSQGTLIEYYKPDQNCVPAPVSREACDKCENGRCVEIDKTKSGCCYNPKKVACDYYERIDDCCPPSPSNYVVGSNNLGPKTPADCKTNWFYPYELQPGDDPRQVCLEVDPSVFENVKYCKQGCCCQRDAAGNAVALQLSQLACGDQ